MKAFCKAAALLPLACTAAVTPSTEAELDEVIVTARHVAEEAARVPLVIDVAAGAELGPAAVKDLETLAARFPGLAFESLWGGQGAAVVLRGLSQPSTAGDNVGVFVDDVYQAGRSVMDVDLLDLERIEVVRGPQNTLFGRSSFAGAIRLVPARPTDHNFYRLQADLGSDAMAGLQAIASLPVGNSGWKARAAARLQRSDGAFPATSQSLGDVHRRSIALTLARDTSEGREPTLALHLRLGDMRQGHPASTTLQAEDFNCGALDSRSGYWSYYCGNFPVPAPAALSTGLPDSRSRYAQASLRYARPMGSLRLFSLSSFYHGDADSIRDFDGGTRGFWSGVCTVDVNCAAGQGQTLTRHAFPNVVSRQWQRVDDWSQELRLGSGSPDGLQWMFGVAGSRTHTREASYYGADRGDLLPGEQLTAIIAATPDITGPASQLNRALVDDAGTTQRLSSANAFRRESAALFGMLEVPLVTPRLHGRFELRAEREVLHVDLRYAAFQPNTDPDPPAGRSWAVTPRLSLDYQATAGWHAFASLARGARSGGVNTVPGLAEDERRFGPEYNWTTEAGMRHAGNRVLRAVQVAAYYVDWRHSQIMGIATTPGVSALVTHNTAGILARGVEASMQWRAGNLVDATFAWSLADARFRAGSDDAGSRQICGLTSQPPGSDFCAFGPPRHGNGSLPLVPYLDGNRTARAPRHSWSASLATPPRSVAGGWMLSGSATLSYRDNVAERPVDGLRYGARHLLGAQLTLERRSWTLALWGSNLTNQRYIRVAGSRGGVFYPQMPRPIDLLYGEGRRVGLTVAFEAGR